MTADPGRDTGPGAGPGGDGAEWCTVGGVRLECRAVPGRAGAPTLVFLHHGLGSAGLWRDFPDRVADATGLAALVYSRASYGRSDALPLPRPGFLDEEADTLVALADARGLDRLVLVGHSDGGSIALAAAAGPARDRVVAVAALAPHVTVEASNLDAIAAMGEAYRCGDLRERLARHHRDVDAAFATWFGGWTDPAFAAWTLVPRLASIIAPVLVVQGDADPYGSPYQPAAVRDGVAGPVEALDLPGVGHDPHREAPDLVLAAIARVLHRAGVG